MTNHIDVVYVENEIEVSLTIKPSAVYGENKTRQQHD